MVTGQNAVCTAQPPHNKIIHINTSSNTAAWKPNIKALEGWFNVIAWFLNVEVGLGFVNNKSSAALWNGLFAEADF